MKIKVDFKPTDLTLREMVGKYLEGSKSDYESPARQHLRWQIIRRLQSSVLDRPDVRLFLGNSV